MTEPEGALERMRRDAAGAVLPESQQACLHVMGRSGCCVRLLFLKTEMRPVPGRDIRLYSLKDAASNICL